MRDGLVIDAEFDDKQSDALATLDALEALERGKFEFVIQGVERKDKLRKEHGQLIR